MMTELQHDKLQELRYSFYERQILSGAKIRLDQVYICRYCGAPFKLNLAAGPASPIAIIRTAATHPCVIRARGKMRYAAQYIGARAYRSCNMPDLVEIAKTEGPITRRELERRLRVTERQVRRMIHELNLSGVPIVSDGRGFCYARTGGTVRAGANRLMSQATDMIRRAAALRKVDVRKVLQELPL